MCVISNTDGSAPSILEIESENIKPVKTKNREKIAIIPKA